VKILLLTQVLPYPPDSGPKVKTWNVIKYLTRQHELTLVSFARGDRSAEIEHLCQYCRAVHTVPIARGVLRDAWYMGRSLLTGQPFITVRDDRAAMRRLVDRLAASEHFHITHADQLNMAQYAARVTGAFKVLDAHNALWVLYRRLWETMRPGPRKFLLGRDWRLLRAYEGRVCREFDAVMAVSDEDRIALQEAARQPVDVTVIPITIDTDEVTVVERNQNARHILHIGTMYWPPNVDGVLWFIQKVYPLIRQQRPDVALDIVGSRPPQELVDLGQEGNGINVTGYVPDPIAYVKRAFLMIVPLRAGGGMRVKILNALAQGVPIVSTTLGAEGIGVTAGENILLADAPSDFAAACLRLLDDADLGWRLAENGRHLVEQKYDYRSACQPLDDVYDRARK